LAKTPPMGWNSLKAFGLDINSNTVMSAADTMFSKGLASAGHQYIAIGWVDTKLIDDCPGRDIIIAHQNRMYSILSIFFVYLVKIFNINVKFNE
jgi:hypothetical protein